MVIYLFPVVIASTLLHIGLCETGLLPSNELFSIDITPPNPIKESLFQCFRCKPGSELKKLVHNSTYDDTSSCNDWKVSKGNAMFNMTLGSDVMPLKMKGLTTYTVHLNGNLLLIQRGSITDGECAGGYFEKTVINRVDGKCTGAGVAKHIPVYAVVQITGGRCEATCPGKVNVWFDPPIKNKLDD